MKIEYNQKELIKAIRENAVVPARNGEYWRDDERQQLVNLYSDGVGISELALCFQRSELGIIQQLTSLGVMRAPKERKVYCKQPKCLCYKCEFQRVCSVSPEQRDEG
ncbi:MAG: hypothetical protein Q4C76_00250 [Bacillota bacterium]|nr:hypothetical protein [Bacillota bacterium]